ncbi:MAG: DNA polymerase III subunit alpha [Bacillota bacterium]
MFTHLHNHTQYSILDGAARIDKMVAKAKKLGMTSLAITDHGVMYGVVDFADACDKAGIKPIIGCEFYVCTDMHVRGGGMGNGEFEHLVLLAKNYTGYLNLVKLDSLAFTEGFYYKPRIDMELLAKHCEGVVCLTACLGGRIPQFLLQGQYKKADEYLKELKSLFGDDVYVEIQDHGIEEQRQTNPLLIKLAKENDLKVVATNDVHYIDKSDAEMHDVLLCMQTGKTLKDENRMRFSSDQFYFKTEDEMLEVFPYIPEAISNTQEVADKCNLKMQYGLPLIPQYYPENGQTPYDFFFDLIEKGLKARYPIITEEIRARADYELGIISKMGFVDYYLIVWDFINYARENDIPVGYGRGSGVGSIIAYAVGITNVDPLRFALLFERFLNPDRVSMPDFDIDFCTERRGEVVQYVVEKYGASNVSQIITFGTLAPRAALKDVARVFDVPFADVNKLTKLIPSNPALKVSLKKIFKTDFSGQEKIKSENEKKAKYFNDIKVRLENVPDPTNKLAKQYTIADFPDFKSSDEFYAKLKEFNEKKEKDDKAYIDPKLNVPELRELYESDETLEKVINMAIEMEGMPKSTGMHAAGVIICKEVISDFVPISRAKDDTTTQFTMVTCERLGLLKMDFLGLNTLTDIKKAITYIKEDMGIDIDFDKLGDTDQGVYELIGSGETDAVFQLESPGMKKFMRELKPTCMEDIIAGISLYRPGPMDYIPEYIKGKQDPHNVKYDHECLVSILKPSYGVIVYQEQVMQIVQTMAGYSLGQADIIRRAMSKKKAYEMDLHRKYFVEGKVAEDGTIEIEGALRKGISAKVALTVFDKMESFAKYAFNKSHAAAYGTVSYQTAFLKKYYPIQFLCSVLNNRITKMDEVSKYTNYAKENGYKILQPDVNKSQSGFRAENGSIRFGLSGIKNVGESAVKELLKERENGEFKTFEDFLSRTNGITNKRLVESLIKAGAFDCFGHRRSQLMAVFDFTMDIISKSEKNKVQGQIDMFDFLGEEKKIEIDYPNLPEFQTTVKLIFEKEVAGLYITGHLLDDVRDKLEGVFNTSFLKVATNENGETSEEALEEHDEFINSFLDKEVTMGGILYDIAKVMTRNNKEMAHGKLEDLYGVIEFVVFPRVYERLKLTLAMPDVRVLAKGKLTAGRDNSYQLVIDNLSLLDDAPAIKPDETSKNAEGKTLYLKIDDSEIFERVLEILEPYKGSSPCIIVHKGKPLRHPNKIAVTEGLLFALEMCLDEKCIVVK